jgi:cysteine-rich repeat protein
MRRLFWVVAAVALVPFLFEREALAQPSGFTRSSVVGVSNGGVSPLADYQVRLVIDTQTLIAAGQMRADANDMVFTLAQCGGMQPVLGHFIESGVNSGSTVVWVKVPNLPSGVTRLNMFYSNPAAAATSNARNVFIGTGVANDPISSTNQVIVGSVNTVQNNQRGFRFTSNVPALVVEFGKRVPNGGDRIVTLFDFNTQAIVRQTTVSGAPLNYVYNPTTPFWLTAGTQYVLEIFNTGGDSYYYDTSSQISADFTYLDMRFCNDCTATTFPTSVLSNYHYGNPDLRYYKRQTSTPEPNQVPVGAGSCNETASCDTDCSPALCGDGVVNATAGEICDDGNTVSTDACVACRSARCGDGQVRAGVEQCDDGNVVNTDACRNDCTVNGGMGGTGTGGTNTGGVSTGGTGTGGLAGEGGDGQAGQGEGGDDGPATGGAGRGGSAAGGRGGSAAGGRGGSAAGGRGGSAAGGRASGGTGGTKPDPGAGGAGGDDDGDEERTILTEGCGCRTAGSSSTETSALSFALLGLVLGVRARRRRAPRPS